MSLCTLSNTLQRTNKRQQRQFVVALLHQQQHRALSSVSSSAAYYADFDDLDEETERTTTTTTRGTTRRVAPFQHASTPARRKKPIYVAATRQHVGKTSVSLALVSGLQKRFEGGVGFMKPVGQRYQQVMCPIHQRRVRVDNDVVCLRQHFCLDHLPLASMSPITIPDQYTRQYLDGEGHTRFDYQKLVQQAHEEIVASMNHSHHHTDSGVVLCEGTGHCAVGSIVNASNARVASWLGADMVLVANGGLGSPFDELELNRALCRQHNVPIAGVIINKVRPDKHEQTEHYFAKALEQHWGDVPLLGCIPDQPFLGCAALADLEKLFDNATLLSGTKHRMRHYNTLQQQSNNNNSNGAGNDDKIQLVAASVEVFVRYLQECSGQQETLYITHSSRQEIVRAFLYHPNVSRSALVVCDGTELDASLRSEIVEYNASRDDDAPPILLVPHHSTTQVMEQIQRFTPKLNTDDTTRIASTVQHYEPYINFDLLLERTNNHHHHQYNKQQQQQQQEMA